MEKEEEKGSMRVVDKRRFKLDDAGQVVEQADAKKYHEDKVKATTVSQDAPVPESKAPGNASAQAPSGQAEVPPAAAAPEAPPTPEAEAPPTEEQPAAEVEGLPLMDFIRQQAYMAMIYLGQQPNPGTGLVQQQPEGVRETINVLLMLRSRTKGNLDTQEELALSDIIRQLQMAYVQMTTAVPPRLWRELLQALPAPPQ